MRRIRAKDCRHAVSFFVLAWKSSYLALLKADIGPNFMSRGMWTDDVHQVFWKSIIFLSMSLARHFLLWSFLDRSLVHLAAGAACWTGFHCPAFFLAYWLSWSLPAGSDFWRVWVMFLLQQIEAWMYVVITLIDVVEVNWLEVIICQQEHHFMHQR